MIFVSKLKTENNSLAVQILFTPQSPPTFHSAERLLNLVRGRGCTVGLYLYY